MYILQPSCRTFSGSFKKFYEQMTNKLNQTFTFNTILFLLSKNRKIKFKIIYISFPFAIISFIKSSKDKHLHYIFFLRHILGLSPIYFALEINGEDLNKPFPVSRAVFFLLISLYYCKFAQSPFT